MKTDAPCSERTFRSGVFYTALFGAVLAALYSTALRIDTGNLATLVRVLVVNFAQVALACWLSMAWMNRWPDIDALLGQVSLFHRHLLLRLIGRAAWAAAIASLIASPVGLLETTPSNWTWFTWLGKMLSCWGFTFGLSMILCVERFNRAQDRVVSGALTRRLSEDRGDLAAKLAALQSQIEPHFIYNTLGNVRALVRTAPEQADALLAQLIEYLRAALPSLRARSCTVAQELELASAYLAVMQVRLGVRLRWHIEADAATRALSCAPGAALTLAENAIKHGIDPLPEGGEVAIVAAQRDGSLVLEVRDTGAGLVPGEGSGVGLANLLERLALLYDGRATFDLTPNTPRGAVARITIPLDLLTAAHADRADT